MKENVKSVKGNRTYKDTVFRMLFREKKELLSLYNAMNGSDYSNPEELQIVTLENAVYMNMKNDLAFLADFHLYLYEHQSTVNSNMPLRFLQYVAKEYEKLTGGDSLYRRKRIPLPAPRFVVFYNGAGYFPEKSELRLSEAYETDKADPQLELKVQVLNINEGNNEKLKEQCRILKEYMLYVDCVRKYAEEVPIEEAVPCAVDECIERGILTEFLRKNKSEVIPVSIFEYNEEETLKAIKADEYELGMQDGIKQGISQGIQQGIQQSIGLMIESCAELGVAKQDTLEKIMVKFSLKEDEANKYMEEYWTRG